MFMPYVTAMFNVHLFKKKITMAKKTVNAKGMYFITRSILQSSSESHDAIHSPFASFSFHFRRLYAIEHAITITMQSAAAHLLHLRKRRFMPPPCTTPCTAPPAISSPRALYLYRLFLISEEDRTLHHVPASVADAFHVRRLATPHACAAAHHVLLDEIRHDVHHFYIR